MENMINDSALEGVAGGSGGEKPYNAGKLCNKCAEHGNMNSNLYKVDGKLFCVDGYHVFNGELYLGTDERAVKEWMAR